MIVAPIERIETVIEAAQPDGVERQRGHVVDDIDLLVAVEPLPLLDQLVGDIDHARVIGLHGAVAERLQQDVVRLAPVRLRGVGAVVSTVIASEAKQSMATKKEWIASSLCSSQ